MDLTKYLRAEEIELARKIVVNPAIWTRMAANLPPDMALAFGTIIGLVEGGPKVIMPRVETCRVLQYVDLDFGLEDYSQPYDTVGVVIPAGFLGPDHQDLLATSSWVPGAPLTIGFVYEDGEIGVFVIDPGKAEAKTIEEYITARMCALDLKELALLKRSLPIVRVVLNLCLFAVERGVRVLPLDPRAEKRRRKARHDERMARLAARDAQEVIIQDLDLILLPPKPPEGEGGGPGGWRQRMHRRRGHWKMQAYGPDRSLRKRIYVQEYMVHDDDDPDGEVQSILS